MVKNFNSEKFPKQNSRSVISETAKEAKAQSNARRTKGTTDDTRHHTGSGER